MWARLIFHTDGKSVFPYTKEARCRQPLLDAASHGVTHNFTTQHFKGILLELWAKALETGTVRRRWRGVPTACTLTVTLSVSRKQCAKRCQESCPSEASPASNVCPMYIPNVRPYIWDAGSRVLLPLHSRGLSEVEDLRSSLVLLLQGLPCYPGRAPRLPAWRCEAGRRRWRASFWRNLGTVQPSRSSSTGKTKISPFSGC